MRQTAVLLSFLLSGTAFAADSQLMNLVMPDAKIVAGVNATTALASPLGQFLISKFDVNGHLGSLAAATGFNPLQDVSEILAATAADPSNPGGLVLARGTFPVDNIVTAVTGSWQASTYDGATLISMTDPKNNKAAFGVAFLGDSIAVVGDLASVKAALDRSTGTNSIDPALAVTVNQLSASEDEWVASEASIASLFPANTTVGAPATGPAAALLPLLKSIQAFNGGVKFGGNVALTGEVVTNSAQNAAALNSVIKLGLLLVGSAGTGPAGNQQIAAAGQVLQLLQVATNGSAVDLSLTIPEAQLESLLNIAPAAKKTVARVERQRSELHSGN